MSVPDSGAVTRTRWGDAAHYRFVRFVLVGSVNTAVDVVVYGLLSWVGLGLVVANLISTTCGLISSYVLNRTYVFAGHRDDQLVPRIRQVALFLLTTGFGLWVLQPLVILAMSGLLAPTSLPRLAQIFVPKLFATAVTLVWNYAFYSLLVFARRADTSVQEPPA